MEITLHLITWVLGLRDARPGKCRSFRLWCLKARVCRVFLLSHPFPLGPQFLPLEFLFPSGEALLNGHWAGVLSKPTAVTDLVQGYLIPITLGSSASFLSPAHRNLMCWLQKQHIPNTPDGGLMWVGVTV